LSAGRINKRLLKGVNEPLVIRRRRSMHVAGKAGDGATGREA